MIKAQQAFFWTPNLKGYGFYGNKTAILCLILEHRLLSVLSEKLHFLEIGPVHQKVSVI